VLLVILNVVVDADAVAIVAADVAAAIVDVDVAALTAVVVVVVVSTAVVGVVALIVAADAGDPVVLLPAVAPLLAAVLSFVAGDRLLSLAPSHLLRMSKPSASNVQDMGPPGGWSKSSPIISRPNWIRASSTITTVCASFYSEKCTE